MSKDTQWINNFHVNIFPIELDKSEESCEEGDWILLIILISFSWCRRWKTRPAKWLVLATRQQLAAPSPPPCFTKLKIKLKAEVLKLTITWHNKRNKTEYTVWIFFKLLLRNHLLLACKYWNWTLVKMFSVLNGKKIKILYNLGQKKKLISCVNLSSEEIGCR